MKISLTSLEKKILSTLSALIILVIIFSILTDGIFVDARNLSNLLRQTVINGILAVGMTYVILLGGIDLSVGSVVGFIGIVVALSQSVWGVGLFGTISIALMIGLVIGLINSSLITKLKIHSFIISFGMMVIARGLAMIVSGGRSVGPLQPSLHHIGEGYINPTSSTILIIGLMLMWIFFILREELKARKEGLAQNSTRVSVKIATIVIGLGLLLLICVNYNGLPIPVIFLGIIAFLGTWILKETRFGRYVYAVGANPKAARLSGIPVNTVMMTVFTAISVLSALSAIVLTARLNSATPSAGGLYELDAIAAVVIGGTSLKGGKGSVLGSLLGALIIASLNNGMSLMNVPDFYQQVLKGLIVILAVAIDSFVEKKKDF